MAQKIRLPGVSDDDAAVLSENLAVLQHKQRRNYLRACYYDGRRVAHMVSPVVPPLYQQLALVLGWSGKAVDLLARRCNLDGFSWPDGDLDAIGGAELFEANSLRAETNQAITDGLIHSSAFVVNTLGGDGEPAGLIHFKSAMDATGQWNSRTRRLNNLLSITDRRDGKVTGLVLYLDGRTITAEKSGSRWSVEQSEHPWGVPADHLPYRPRLKRPFGSSRISRPMMSIQDSAVRELMRLEGHLDVFSFPDYWMLGADESIFRNADGSPQAAWQVVLGRLRGIPDDADRVGDPGARADVKQFPAASPQPHLAALNGFAKLFSREASLPDTALAITDVSNPTSAESYDSSQYELIAEAEGATDDWSPALARAFRRGLAMANGFDAVPPQWSSIAPKWRNPRYLTKAAQADAGQKQIAAVPWLAETKIGLELLGLTQQQVAEAMGERARAQSLARLDMLASLGPMPQAASTDVPTTGAEDADVMKAKFDALGVAVRAGVSPEDAARRLGLEGIQFTGAVPVALRMPESQAGSLEER